MSRQPHEGHTTMRIGIAAPPVLPIPPRAYAGTERVVSALVDALVERRHEVVLFASGDSSTAARLVPTVPTSIWTDGGASNAMAAHVLTAELVARHTRGLGLDLVHSHLESIGLPLARRLDVPMMTTLHLNPGLNGMPLLLAAMPEAPLVAISDSQRREVPAANWIATIHHGLPLHRMAWSGMAGDYLVLVGRAAPDKGVAAAIEIARRSAMPLRIVAKAREPAERRCLEDVIRPAERRGGVTFLGELESRARDTEFVGAYATLMMGAWPEPFGLVSIESLATGTPVIGRRRGALPEIVRHGVDGFLVDDIDGAVAALDDIVHLDRAAIRRSALERFGIGRMVDEYEALYRRVLGERPEPMQRPALPSSVTASALPGRIDLGHEQPLHFP
jgi:glycosyltransferase involved in cell wall biosynthesis